MLSLIAFNLRFSAESFHDRKVKLFFVFVVFFSPCLSLPPQDEALQLCIKISTAIDRVEYMFTTEFEAEVEESESATLHQYYREAMIQGYNFAFEVTVTRCMFSKKHMF